MNANKPHKTTMATTARSTASTMPDSVTMTQETAATNAEDAIVSELLTARLVRELAAEIAESLASEESEPASSGRTQEKRLTMDSLHSDISSLTGPQGKQPQLLQLNNVDMKSLARLLIASVKNEVVAAAQNNDNNNNPAEEEQQRPSLGEAPNDDDGARNNASSSSRTSSADRSSRAETTTVEKAPTKVEFSAGTLASASSSSNDADDDEDDDLESVLSQITGVTGIFDSKGNLNDDQPQIRAPKRDATNIKKMYKRAVLCRSFSGDLSPASVASSEQQQRQQRRGGKKPGRVGRSVSFNEVQVRQYERTLSDNPSSRNGPSIGLGWKYVEKSPQPIGEWEYSRRRLRSSKDLVLRRGEREKLLREVGVTERDIALAVRDINKARAQRRQTITNLGVQGVEEAVEKVTNKFKKVLFFNSSNKPSQQQQAQQKQDLLPVKGSKLAQAVKS